MAKVVKPHVRVDATASKATDSRRGVGRVRRLHTQVLWVREAGGTPRVDHRESAADMGTKHLAQREMHECLRRGGCHISERTVDDDVQGRTGDLSQATLRLWKQIKNIVMD